jgi:Domain of unknown function (DUF1905)
MKFRTCVEPPEAMRGLEIPPEVVEALGGGKRPAVTITINGHSWESRVAIMRGRYLLGLSTANRQAAGVVTGDQADVGVDLDASPACPMITPSAARPRSPPAPAGGYCCRASGRLRCGHDCFFPSSAARLVISFRAQIHAIPKQHPRRTGSPRPRPELLRQLRLADPRLTADKHRRRLAQPARSHAASSAASSSTRPTNTGTPTPWPTDNIMPAPRPDTSAAQP